MNQALLNGKELEYEVRGVGEPVLLVHGSHIADAFTPLLAQTALTERYRLIMHHRAGFAGSTHLESPFSIAQQAADCRALMRHLGVSRAHVVGHSYGGAIVLQLALDAPDAVQSLALLEPALMMVPSAPALMQALGPVLQMYEADDRAGAVDSFLQAVMGTQYRSVLDRALPGAFAQAVADADTFFRLELPALQQWNFTQADAKRISQAVLSVLGADSHGVWPGWVEIHELIQDWWPNAETFVLTGATHGLQIMNPHDLANALASFFARHSLKHMPGRSERTNDSQKPAR